MFINTKTMKKLFCRMNKIFSCLMILMLLASCEESKDKDVVKSYYENGNIKSELRYKDGCLDGECIWYFSNGKPELKINYVMDTLQGESLRWYENGFMQSRCFYKNNEYDSIFESYNVMGKMVKREYYKEGVKHGALTQWYNNGNLFLEGAYDEGMFDGRWIIYYENGSIGSTATYNKGNGVQIGYSPDGVMMTKIYYKDNEKDGEEMRYNKQGEVMEILIWEAGEFVRKIDKKH